MIVKQYENLIDSILDTEIFNFCMLLNGIKLNKSEKLYLLDKIAYRMQIEFQKHVYLITSDKHVETDMQTICRPFEANDIPKLFDRTDTIFIVDINLPYFEDKNNWETSIINTLTNYFYTVIGFTSNKQVIKIYENL